MNPLMLTLNLKEGYISLNDGTLEALGHPRQIQLRLNDEEASLALMPCTMNDAEAVVVPTDPVVRYEIGAKYLLRKIKGFTGWQDDQPRACEGEYIPSHRAIRFCLRNAVPLGTPSDRQGE
ncbi:MAG: hypothetical protein IKE25_12360 [Clostridia bacterium]|nr:hypothetical protein [Clostridia bacterium]